MRITIPFVPNFSLTTAAIRVSIFLGLMGLCYVVTPLVWAKRSEQFEVQEEALSAAMKTLRRRDEERRWLCKLAHAVNEAHANCELLSIDAHPAAALRIDFKEALAAMEGNPLVHSLTYGELPQLIDLIVFLEAYGRSSRLDEEQAEALLEGRGYSHEDLRFVVGFLHWYLSCAFEHWSDKRVVDPLKARALLHSQHAHPYQPERLKVFKDKDFGTFLGELD